MPPHSAGGRHGRLPPRAVTSTNTAVLGIRVLTNVLEVTVPKALTMPWNMSLAIALFPTGALELRDSSNRNQFSCTGDALSWQCLNTTDDSEDAVASLSQPEWHGSYTVQLFTDDCRTPLASSSTFLAGPEPPPLSPLIEVTASGSKRSACTEFPSQQCPELTVRVTLRGTSASADESIALLPITPWARSTWVEQMSLYTAADAGRTSVLGSTGSNVSLVLTSPLIRSAYVAVLLQGSNDLPWRYHPESRIIAASDVFVAGRDLWDGLDIVEHPYDHTYAFGVSSSQNSSARLPLTEGESISISASLEIEEAGVSFEMSFFSLQPLEVDTVLEVVLALSHYRGYDLSHLLAPQHVARTDQTIVDFLTVLSDLRINPDEILSTVTTDSFQTTTRADFADPVSPLARVTGHGRPIPLAAQFTLSPGRWFMNIDHRVFNRSVNGGPPSTMIRLHHTFPLVVLASEASCSQQAAHPNSSALSPRAVLPPAAMPSWAEAMEKGAWAATAIGLAVFVMAYACVWRSRWSKRKGRVRVVPPSHSSSSVSLPIIFAPSWSRLEDDVRSRGVSFPPLSSASSDDRDVSLVPRPATCSGSIRSSPPLVTAQGSGSEGTMPSAQGSMPSAQGTAEGSGSSKETHVEVLETSDYSSLSILSPIGHGGFAVVWMARWQGNDLAVKVLKVAHESFDAPEVAREVAILRRLRHPCICALFGLTRVEQRPALVLEYMGGGSLAKYLFHRKLSSPCFSSDPIPDDATRLAAERGAAGGGNGPVIFTPLAVGTAEKAAAEKAAAEKAAAEIKKIGFAVQLASGLCFLHSHGILHCDVKTDNALLDRTHSACKLVDFGLASLSLNSRDHSKVRVSTDSLPQMRFRGGDAPGSHLAAEAYPLIHFAGRRRCRHAALPRSGESGAHGAQGPRGRRRTGFARRPPQRVVSVPQREQPRQRQPHRRRPAAARARRPCRRLRLRAAALGDFTRAPRLQGPCRSGRPHGSLPRRAAADLAAAKLRSDRRPHARVLGADPPKAAEHEHGAGAAGTLHAGRSTRRLHEYDQSGTMFGSAMFGVVHLQRSGQRPHRQTRRPCSVDA